jgi:hypothetical protein
VFVKAPHGVTRYCGGQRQVLHVVQFPPGGRNSPALHAARAGRGGAAASSCHASSAAARSGGGGRRKRGRDMSARGTASYICAKLDERILQSVLHLTTRLAIFS